MAVEPVIEVQFTAGTWTDITDWVRVEDGISIVRGRQDEQTEARAGTLAFTLDNRDRRFTPLNSGSPYYPNVRKGLPIRVSVEVAGQQVQPISNSSFETDTSGWAPGGAQPSLTRTTGWSPGIAGGGTASLRMFWGLSSGQYVFTTMTGLVPGRTYTASAYVYVDSGMRLRLAVAGITAGAFTTVSGTWGRITVTFTATSDTETLMVERDVVVSGGNYIDCVQVEEGTTATAYGPTTISGTPTRVTRFYGYVNEWPVDFDGGGRVVFTRVTASDGLKRLGQLAPMRSLLEEELLALGPDLYYTLSEPSGATAAGDTSGTNTTQTERPLSVFQVAGSAGEVKFGGGIGPGVDGLAAVEFVPAAATDGKGIRGSLPANALQWVLACWVNTTVKGKEFAQLSYSGFSDGIMAAALGTDATTGQLRIRSWYYSAGTPNGGSTVGGPNIADGRTHFVAVWRRSSDNAAFAYVDGATVGSGFVIPNLSQSGQYNQLAAGGFMHGATADLFTGTVAHLWYARERTSMPAWANAWTAGNGSSETTTARFSRLCRLLGLTQQTLGTTSQQIAAQAAGGKAPMQAFRELAAVEMGQVYAARGDARLVFECRNYRYDTTPDVTLTRDDLREGSLKWADDDQYLLNDVTNQRDGGAPQRHARQDSIAKYGRYAGGQTLPWATDHDAYLNAYWRVTNGADPEPRVKQFAVAANALASYASLLGLDLSDVVRLSNLPSGSPRTQVDVRIEGYSERIDYALHEITFHTSPAVTFHP